MLAEARTFENAVVGEGIDPFIVAPGVDRQTIARVQHANFLTVFESPRYRHRGLPPIAEPKSPALRSRLRRGAARRRPTNNRASRLGVSRCARRVQSRGAAVHP